jgi:hypothetical protein
VRQAQVSLFRLRRTLDRGNRNGRTEGPRIALSEKIAGATLRRLKGSGHELHETDWGQIIASIIEHTGG